MAISLTEKAARRASDFIARKGRGVGLRFGVEKTGCSGWGYRVEIAEEIGEQDRVFESHGVQVIVDTESLPLVDGTEIDYGQEGLNQVFKFANPNVAAECGCGESFTVISPEMRATVD